MVLRDPVAWKLSRRGVFEMCYERNKDKHIFMMESGHSFGSDTPGTKVMTDDIGYIFGARTAFIFRIMRVRCI